ncbi:MAG: choice-of-anchor D domain-containing protein [Deltaproteobacteria bacterium]|nr:choice-of-anchor D domain-containing protein [Deltaproteobacteria bacterium]
MTRRTLTFLIATLIIIGCQCDDSSLGELSSKLAIFINGKEISDSFYFGEVTVTKEVSADVELKNQGETEIVISSISISGQASTFKVDPIESINGFSNGRISLLSGSSITFKIYYRPVEPAPPLDEDVLIISTNLKDAPQREVKLSGKGIKASIEVNPVDIIDFGKVDVYSKATRDIIVKNTGTDKLVINSAGYTPNGNSTDIYLNSIPTTPLELNPEQEVTFTLIYVPTDIGEDKGVLRFENNSKDLPRIDIPVKGEGVSPLIRIEPSDIDFGGVEVNQSSSKDFVVYNKGNKDLIIYYLDFSELSSKYLSVTDHNVQKTIAPQSSTKYTVTFAPKNREGTINSKLQVHCNDPQLVDRDADNHYIAYVNIKSRTPFPKIDVTGAVTIQLGCKTPYNASEPTCASGCTMDCCCFDYNGFVIRNIGDAPLIVTRVELVDNGGGMIEMESEKSTPYTLNNNESTKLTIRYKPTSFGQHRGKIVIESNDPYESNIEVSIVASSFQK